MIEVGVRKAKANWSALLDRVQQGEEVVVTRRAKAVARLVSAKGLGKAKLDDPSPRSDEPPKGLAPGGSSSRKSKT
jgi:prevent-host-death family protein